jgi:hypothetical protein
LLFLTGLLVWHSGSPPQMAHSTAQPAGESLASKLRRYNVSLARTEKPADGVSAMADAAEKLHARGRDTVLTASADDLADLADVYDSVVREGVMKPAEGLSADERRKILQPIAETLREAESQWQQLSQQNGLPKRVQKALEKCAFAARDGHARLKELCAES